MTAPSWFKDWSGDDVAIIASGPSTKNAKLELLRDRMRVIAIKQNVDLCPWADVVYGCDAAWWRYRRGLPEYRGLKIRFGGDPLPEINGISFIDISRTGRKEVDDNILIERPGLVGNGGNSGFQALNIAVQFGARRILLVGFDMTDRSGVHWYGRNTWAFANNPDRSNFVRWLSAFQRAKPVLEYLGVEVVSASPSSEMKIFKRWSIEDTLRAWK